MARLRHFGAGYSHFGEDTYGHDVKGFGDTTGKYFMWDASANAFILVGDMTQTGNQAVTGTHSASGGYTGNLAGNVSGYALKSEARTATDTGATTGTISAGVTHVVVTCDDANKIIILPAPVPGLVITLINGATGYELIG